jgi:hypothetical protein
MRQLVMQFNADNSIIIIIGTTALFEPRPSSEASASRPYF